MPNVEEGEFVSVLAVLVVGEDDCGGAGGAAGDGPAAMTVALFINLSRTVGGNNEATTAVDLIALSITTCCRFSTN